MRNNVTMVLERDTKLSDLDRRADDLQHASVNFATSAKKVRNKMWWENLKMKLIIGGILLAILMIIIIVIVCKTSGSGGSESVATAAPVAAVEDGTN